MNPKNLALISDVFVDDDAIQRLYARLAEARRLGATLALLPELPLNPWSPATKDAREDDAEPPGGVRHQIQSRAAKDVGIALIGGAIVQDSTTGIRHNTSLIFNDSGELLGLYCKLHLPEEPGFWETSHYFPGFSAPSPIEVDGMQIGVQICSDINRPEGSHLLGALGTQIIVAPRATEAATYDRWRPVFIANALTSAVFVASVNRPKPEQGVLLGGPSIVVSPSGQILLETTDPVGVATIDLDEVANAKRAYPGYLPVRADLYAATWAKIADS